MTAVAPISEVLIDVNRAAVDASAPTKAAIDRGCSLSKFLYIAKDFDLSKAHYTFHCALFRNEDFEGGLYFLKEKALLPSAGKLRVTGAGCDKYMELITEVLGLEIEFIEENGSNIRGLQFLLLHTLSPDDLFFPKIEIQTGDVIERPAEMRAMVEKMKDRMRANNDPDPNAKFPCVFVLVGSASVCYLITPEGKGHLLGINLNGGKTFLGLGKALVGTNDYDEIMQLAEKGCVTNIDTTIGEFLNDDPNSPYGRFPAHLPLFSFGKMINSQLPLEHYEAADRAVALVRMMSMTIYALASSSVMAASVTKVFIGGNGAQSKLLRRFFTNQDNLSAKLMDANFLKTGHTGAFGAMTTTEAEAKSILL